MGPQTHPNWMEFYRRWAHINDLTYTVNNVWLIFCSGIHPSQYPPLYSHPGLPALERERLGLPPGPQHSLDPNEQMVRSPSRFSHPNHQYLKLPIASSSRCFGLHYIIYLLLETRIACLVIDGRSDVPPFLILQFLFELYFRCQLSHTNFYFFHIFLFWTETARFLPALS